jgi:protocatechuate 3,4-dioxygenase, beta subunit
MTTRYLLVPSGAAPEYLVPAYGSSHKRAPRQPLVSLSGGGLSPLTAAPLLEHSGPRLSAAHFPPILDLSRPDGDPDAGGALALGERIVVAGRVTDEAGRPVPDAMIEVWQANAAGRYHHERDTHDAPLDPNFRGVGRVFTDEAGAYRFTSIKPGAYPWRNHPNAWRPNHIHFSLFGPSWGARLVTQMYFPGDPLLAIDPIFHAISDEAARSRLIAAFDLSLTQPDRALGYRFDVVLRGLYATPFEAHAGRDTEVAR